LQRGTEDREDELRICVYLSESFDSLATDPLVWVSCRYDESRGRRRGSGSQVSQRAGCLLAGFSISLTESFDQVRN
jgi:hypothetical protein